MKNIKVISIMGILFGIFGCDSFADNAICYNGSNGLFAVRKKNNIPVVLMVFTANEFKPINKKIEFTSDGSLFLDVEELIGSRFLLNRRKVDGQPRRWGPVKVGNWPQETMEYNFNHFSFWVNSKQEIIGVRIMLEGVSKWKNKSLLINGIKINSLTNNDFIKMIGDNVDEQTYFSEF